MEFYVLESFNLIFEEDNIVVYYLVSYLELIGWFDIFLIGFWLIGFILVFGKVLLEFFLLWYVSRKVEVYDFSVMEVEW